MAYGTGPPGDEQAIIGQLAFGAGCAAGARGPPMFRGSEELRNIMLGDFATLILVFS